MVAHESLFKQGRIVRVIGIGREDDEMREPLIDLGDGADVIFKRVGEEELSSASDKTTFVIA